MLRNEVMLKMLEYLSWQSAFRSTSKLSRADRLSDNHYHHQEGQTWPLRLLCKCLISDMAVPHRQKRLNDKTTQGKTGNQQKLCTTFIKFKTLPNEI